MKWTQQHARNAVNAKARKRMADTDWKSEVRRRDLLRRAKAKWRLQIRDLEHGDSLTLLLYRLPWPSRFLGSDRKEYSASKLGRAVALLFAQAA